MKTNLIRDEEFKPEKLVIRRDKVSETIVIVKVESQKELLALTDDNMIAVIPAATDLEILIHAVPHSKSGHSSSRESL